VDPSVLLSLVEAAGVRQNLSDVPPSDITALLETLAVIRTRPSNALLAAVLVGWVNEVPMDAYQKD